MSQQINLFNPIFLKQKKYFSAVTMAQALALILLGSLLLGVYAHFQLMNLGKEAQATTTQLEAAKAQLVKVNAAYGPRSKSKIMEEELQKTEADTKSLQQVFDVLQRGDFGNTRGYSEYLRAFSRQIVDGVWLTGFYINGAGTELGIRGRAMQPELVPAYINRLKREPVMQGKSFAMLEIQSPQMEQASQTGKPNAPNALIAVGSYIEFNLQSVEGTREQFDLPGAKSK